MKIKNFLSNKYILLLSRLILGSVFIIASIDKISVAEAFAVQVQGYRLIPLPLVNVLALIVPWLELVCGLFIVSGVFMRGSSTLVSALLVIFMVALSSALLRGLEIDCGCFGSAHSSPVSWFRVLEDVGLLLLGVHLYICHRSTPAV